MVCGYPESSVSFQSNTLLPISKVPDLVQSDRQTMNGCMLLVWFVHRQDKALVFYRYYDPPTRVGACWTELRISTLVLATARILLLAAVVKL